MTLYIKRAPLAHKLQFALEFTFTFDGRTNPLTFHVFTLLVTRRLFWLFAIIYSGFK